MFAQVQGRKEKWIQKGLKKLLEVVNIHCHHVVMVSWVYTSVKIDHIVLFKYVQFTDIHLYLNKVVKKKRKCKKTNIYAHIYFSSQN